jgi:hypothetical protein
LEIEMTKKDSSANKARDARAKKDAITEGNPMERERSFARQRAAVLRPPGRQGAQTANDPREESFAIDAEDDSGPPGDYKEKHAQYRDRQHRASKSTERPQAGEKDATEPPSREDTKP